jgi:hypothetical protein
MMDAYTHLDLTCANPIADMKARMAQAVINRALAVETWKGDNLPWLQKIMSQLSPQFRIAPCFRPDQQQPSTDILQNDAVMALRVRTADIRQLQGMERLLAASGKWLIPHAEDGIGPLKKELLALARRAAGLQIYVPHLGHKR